jgi:hypothetical protein
MKKKLTIDLKKTIFFLFFLLNFCFINKSSAITTTCIVNGGDWTNPATWDNGVPVSGVDVAIPAGFIPAVTTAVVCNNLVFSASTNATMTLSGNLTVEGNLTIAQTVSANATTIAAGTQTLIVNGTVTFSTVGTSTISASSGVLTFDAAITLGTLDKITFTGAGIGNFNAGLTDAAGDLTLFSGATINMGGNYTVNSGTVIWTTGSNVIFNNTSLVTATSLIAFYNVTISSGTLSLTGSISVYGNWNITAGATLSNGGAIAGTGSKTFSAPNGTTIILTGTSTLPTGFASVTLGVTSLVNYNGSGTQIVNAVNYGNLTFSNSGSRTLASSGTIGISSVFTPGTNSCTITGSTVNFNSTSAQTIPAFNYNNLTISGARTTNSVTLDNGGVIGIAQTFTPSASFTSGGYINTNNTIDFNSTGSQTIPVFNYNNLTISGARTTGTITLPAGTIGIAEVFNPTASFTSGGYANVASNIVEFNGNGAQTIPAFNYQYLRVSGTRTTNNVTLVNGGTIGIAGATNSILLTAIFTSGTYINTNNTINFNSISPQSVTIPAAGFINNLTFNCTGVASLTNAITAVNVTGNVSVQSGSFSNAGFPIAGNSGATFSVSNGALFDVAKSTSMPTGFGTMTLGASSTVDFIGPNSQTVDAYNYGNLTISGTRINLSVTLATGGTIGIAGTFSPTATFTVGGYVTTNNTIDFNGSTSQTIPAFNYNNLTSSSSGARTLDGSGTIGIKGTFIPGTNSYTVTGSTVNFNGTTAQTIPAFNYYNLTTSGTRATTNITFANGGTVGVANVLSLTATFSSGVYVLTNNTVNFNGTVSQSIPQLTYTNLTTTGASTKSLSAATTITGVLTINTGSTLDASSSNYNIIHAGNWINNGGTFNPRSATVTFNGTTTVSGSSTTSFNNVTISGALTGHSTAMNVAGNWINNGTYTHNSGLITFNGTTTVSGSSTTSFRNITISGTLTAHSTAMNIAGNFVNNGTFNANSGLVTFNGTTTISGSSTTSLNRVTISGTLTGHSGNMNVSGNWINNGSYTHNSGTVTYNGTSSITGSATTSFNNITISGTLTAHPTLINVAGNWVNNGTFTHNSGSVIFNGTTTISGSSTTSMNNVTISGALTAPSGNLNISGNFINDGSFAHNSGTVTFNGTTTVSGSSNTTFNNVTVTSILNGHNNSMDIAGDMVTNGTYNSNNGLLIFNGPSTQSLSGSGTANFELMTLNNTSGMNVISGTYNLHDVITLTAGTISNVGATFTLVADSSRYSRIAPINALCGTCGFSGNFIVQRYIPSRTIGTWANLSSPVSNATMADWDNSLFLEYPFTGFDTISNRPTGSNVLAYDELSAAYYELNASTPLSAGMGFEIGLTDDQTNTNFSITTLNTVGTPNFGDYDIPLSYTAANGPAYPIGYSGENLVGNPYASAIDLSALIITNALSTVDVYDYTIDNYTTLSGSDIIGPHQGFWAYAQTTGASIFIPESAKTTNSTTNIYRTSVKNERPYMNLTLSSADASNTMAHTLMVACNENASDGWDNNDHPFRKSLNPKAPSITANAGEAIVSINTFNNNHETYVMPLNLRIGIDGKYQLATSGIQHVRDYAVVLLEDKLTHTFINLNNSNDYTFNAKTTDSKQRFALHFSKSPDYNPASTAIVNNLANEVQILQNSTGNMINFNLSKTENTVISVMDLLGKNIIGTIDVAANNQSVNITLPESFHGLYFITVQSESGKIVKKFVAEK